MSVAEVKPRKRQVRLTSDQQNAICARYLAGEGTFALMREFNVVSESIRKLLISRGIERRQRRHVSTDEAAEIVSLYLAGESSAVLATRFGFTDVTICNVLRRAGIVTRDPASARRVYPLNESAFTARSPEADYWTGFLMADGCVYDHGRIVVVLNTGDRRHLEKLRHFIESPARPIGDKHDRVRLQIDSMPMAKDIARWGVVPRKSLVAVAKGGVENSPDFWRGMIDGDGTIGITRRGYPSMGLCGGNAIMGQFQAYLAERVFDGMYRPNVTWQGDSNLAIIKISGSYAQEAIAHLYGHATDEVVLDRKYLRAMKALEYQIAPNRNALAKLRASAADRARAGRTR